MTFILAKSVRKVRASICEVATEIRNTKPGAGPQQPGVTRHPLPHKLSITHNARWLQHTACLTFIYLSLEHGCSADEGKIINASTHHRTSATVRVIPRRSFILRRAGPAQLRGQACVYYRAGPSWSILNTVLVVRLWTKCQNIILTVCFEILTVIGTDQYCSAACRDSPPTTGRQGKKIRKNTSKKCKIVELHLSVLSIFLTAYIHCILGYVDGYGYNWCSKYKICTHIGLRCSMPSNEM